MVELIIELLRQNGIDFGFFRLMNYLTFRAMMGMTTALLFTITFGFPFIVRLYRRKLRDTSGDYLSLKVSSKRGTPTAGGIIIIAATLFSLFLWGNLHQPTSYIITSGFVYFGLVGLLDDIQKSRSRSSISGLSQLGKTFLLLCYIVPFALYYLSPLNPVPERLRTLIFIPFYKYPLLDLGPVLFFFFMVFVMFAIVNAVNLTDGMDGLLSGTASMILGVYCVFGYIIGNTIASEHYLFPHISAAVEVVVFGATLIGALLGFIWYNSFPAQVFMGDTGSLAIGGALSIIIFTVKQEMLFPIAGGVLVLEVFSSLVQEKIGNRIGRRIFYRAPFHHSLTHRGIAEPKAVVRIWIISILLALFSLLSLKVR